MLQPDAPMAVLPLFPPWDASLLWQNSTSDWEYWESGLVPLQLLHADEPSKRQLQQGGVRPASPLLGQQGSRWAAPLRWQSDDHSQAEGYTVPITLQCTRGAAYRYQYQIFPHTLRN